MRHFAWSGRAIPETESVVLDAVRSSAALMVFLAHWSQLTGHFAPLQDLARIGVLLFFVLSGFVISGTSQFATARTYAIARVARLYSVVLPVLIILPLLSILVIWFWPSQAAEFSPPNEPVVQWISTATFTTRWWFRAIPSFSDWPFWTLSYEAGFYIVWGAIAFGGQHRLIWTLLAAALVGPNILVLFPIWLSGAAFFLSGLRLTKTGAIIAIPAAAALFFLGRQSVALSLLPNVPDLWGDAKLFISDWFRGLSCLLILASCFALSHATRFSAAAWIAKRSFTLYLLHFPILRFLSIAAGQASTTMAIAIGAAALVICLTVGSIIEPTSRQWRSAINALWPRATEVISR